MRRRSRATLEGEQKPHDVVIRARSEIRLINKDERKERDWSASCSGANDK